MGDSNVNVKVAVRCRPMSRKEADRNCFNIVQIPTSSQIIIKPPDNSQEEKSFAFDYVYGGNISQTAVYNDLGKPVVSQALEGFNGTIFAYGQTGSGKTFSMMGTDDNKGIIPLLNDELWQLVTQRVNSNSRNNSSNSNKVVSQFFITVSFLEVYNEDVKDLLNPSDKKLKIHESPDLGIYVEGLCELVVKDATDVIRLIYQGNAVRRVASTQMNDQSSRSHSVFTIKIEQKICTNLSDTRQREQLIKAKVNLVDLAGSERASKTGATGQTLKEGANINKSLMTLGNVINALSEGLHSKKTRVIPYRESKLTRLLQESLGGNARTIMIASISPADYNFNETLSTLKYANRAKSIENAAVKNEDLSERIIKDLQDQIALLKQQLQDQSHQGATKVNPELEAKLREMEQSQLSAWQEKERLSEQLELERQQNMNSIISQMMQSVKEQKVEHMKNIKRLTNEKNILTKKFKELKDESISLKQSLDMSMNKYQEHQASFDSLTKQDNEELLDENSELTDDQRQRREQREKESESLANEMLNLLSKIDEEQVSYKEKKTTLIQLKQRLDSIELEITDERGELVASAGILQQNDRIREQIKEEERIKMKEEFDKELDLARQQLEEEKLLVRETIQSELVNEMNKDKSEIKMLKSLLKLEESKNVELHDENKQLKEYVDQLEHDLADSEVAKESAQDELEKAKVEAKKQHDNAKLLQEDVQLLKDGKAKLQQEIQQKIATLAEEHSTALERAKVDVYKKMMEGFQSEAILLEQRHQQTQKLLAQATEDIMHLMKKNQELENQLYQAVYYEPNIS